jgi:hypothetical protein
MDARRHLQFNQVRASHQPEEEREENDLGCHVEDYAPERWRLAADPARPKHSLITADGDPSA